ncbi:hypothetical protein ACFLRX_08360 [Acidobacteriota bacterium]
MQSKKILILSVILLCAGPFLLQGNQINLSNTSNQSVWSAIAINSAGEIMVVWSEWDSNGIWYRIQKNGEWSGKKKAGIVYQKSWSNQLAVDSFGMFHLSYADGAGSLSRDIYYSYFTGSQWSKAERVYASPHNSAWNRIDVDTNNDIYVQWYHKYYNPEDVSDVVSISKPRLGRWPSSYENVSRSLGWESIHPAFRVRNGNVYSCYMDDEGPRRVFFAERIQGRWSKPVEVSPGYYPALEVDSSENIHIVWSQWDGNFYYKSRENGRWGSTAVISNGQAPLYFGDLKYKNNVLVANWVQMDGDKWGIYAAAKIPGGRWITPIKIGATLPLGEKDERMVQVALDSKGCAHFVWHGIGLGGQTDIFYEKHCITGDDVNFIEVDKVMFNFVAEKPVFPSPQTFQVRNTGKENMAYSISSDKAWLVVDPVSGSSSGEWDTISVSVDITDLQAGVHHGTISVSSSDAYNSPARMSVSVTLSEKTKPYITLNKIYLPFSSYVASENPLPQTFSIRNGGIDTLNYSVSSSSSWLSISPNSGSSSGEWDEITVSADHTGRDIGVYQGTITVSSPDADNSPQNIIVESRIELPPWPFPPLNVQVNRISHEGLMIHAYHNEITWQGNPKNDGLFHMQKYNIFRKKVTEDSSAYVWIDAVSPGEFSFVDGLFDSVEERNIYTYAVSSVDDSERESPKIETFLYKESSPLLNLSIDNQDRIFPVLIKK